MHIKLLITNHTRSILVKTCNCTRIGTLITVFSTTFTLGLLLIHSFFLHGLFAEEVHDFVTPSVCILLGGEWLAELTQVFLSWPERNFWSFLFPLLSHPFHLFLSLGFTGRCSNFLVNFLGKHGFVKRGSLISFL